VRWSLAHHGRLEQTRLIPVDLLNGESESAEHRARNPLGFVPVLLRADGQTLCESLAMLEWLEEQPSPAPSLLPEDPWLRAQVRMLAQVIVADTQPLQNLGPQFQHSPDDALKRSDWARHWIREGLHAYETLARPIAGQLSVGDRVSLADLCLIPQLYNARRYEVRVEEEFPLLARIEEKALSLPAAKASRPDRFQPPSRN